MNETPREFASVKAVFAELKNEEPLTTISPELRDKIEAAFIALEDVLTEAFPNSRKLSLILGWLERASMYVVRLF